MKYLIVGTLGLWFSLAGLLTVTEAQQVLTRSAVARAAPNYMGVSFGDHEKVRRNILRMFGVFELEGFAEVFFPVTTEGVVDQSWGSITYVPNEAIAGVQSGSLTTLSLADHRLLEPGQPLGRLNNDRWSKLWEASNLPDNNSIPRWLSPILFPTLDESWAKHHGSGRCTFSSFDDVDRADAILNSQPLSELLDEQGLSVIDQYGVAIFSSDFKPWLPFAGFQPAANDQRDSLGKAEAIWLEKLQKVWESAAFGMVGVNYHTKLLEVQTEMTLENEDLLDGMFDMAATQQAWQPTLGLEAQDLLAAGCLQLDIFPTPAAARSLPLYVLQQASKKKALRFLQGNLSQIAGELTGDVWKHLSAVRLALYQNPESPERKPGVGDLALVLIADTKNQKEAIEELRFLASLRNPMMAAERTSLLGEKIDDLILQLAEQDVETCCQAQTRLKLVGPAAIPALEKAADSGDPRLSSRARDVLSEVLQTQTQAKNQHTISDPFFWTTLNPSLDFEASNRRVGAHVCHAIHISPDPSKTQFETEQATATMRQAFGDQWNQVKVVPVGDHLVLMLGSDNARLQRVVRDVEQGRGHLWGKFEGQVTGTREASFHCFFNPTGIAKLLKLHRSSDLDSTDSLGWLSLRLRERTIAKKLVVSVKDLHDFVQSLGY